MSGVLATTLFAIHISDGVLTVPWLFGGFVTAAGLAALGLRRTTDEDIPTVALLTAAFFVASLIHVRIGPSSAHLILNGLLGVVLGIRAGLAVPIGLFLQAALLAHGGFSSLGVNSCIITIPALAAGWIVAALRRTPWVEAPWFRGALVFVSFVLWAVCADFALGSLAGHRTGDGTGSPVRLTEQLALNPAVVVVLMGIAGAIAVWGECRMENAPEFPLGLLAGTVAVLLTLGLNCVVLVFGGSEDWRSLALVLFLAHMPIAVVESLIVGCAIGFLARVKPELIGWDARENRKCPADFAA